MHGYEDVNDEQHLRKDPIIQEVLDGKLASQPTVSRFENQIGKKEIFQLAETFVDRYVESLKGRTEIVIDVDATDSQTTNFDQIISV